MQNGVGATRPFIAVQNSSIGKTLIKGRFYFMLSE